MMKVNPKNKIIFCKKCVMSNQRPGSTIEFKKINKEEKKLISFNEEGVCSACEYKEVKDTKIDWKERQSLLKKLCEKYRSRNGSYDVVVPGSGGKDSVFTSHILKHKYNMNPLTITWSPHQYTNIGWQNFQQWINAGFSNILLSPNGKLHRLLTKKAFLKLSIHFNHSLLDKRYVVQNMLLYIKYHL